MNFKNLSYKETKEKITSKYNLELTENISENDFILYEAITPEQKEAGQREIWKDEQNVMHKVKSYFLNKWKDIKNLKNKKIEKERLNELEKYFNKYEPSEETIKWFKNKIGSLPKMPISTISNENSKSPAGVDPYRINTTFVKDFNVKNILGDRHYLNGFDFKGNDINKVENTIWKFIIMHEQGHLYDYLIQIIETGKIDSVGTAMFQFPEYKEKVNNSERNANAYAIDNMYRKDRREFLKNFKAEDPEDLNKLKDAYLKGLKNKSKTYSKTKESIDKENSHFNY